MKGFVTSTCPHCRQPFTASGPHQQVNRSLCRSCVQHMRTPAYREARERDHRELELRLRETAIKDRLRAAGTLPDPKALGRRERELRLRESRIKDRLRKEGIL